MALYKLVSLEPCDCCNATHEVAALSDIQAYLSEHGRVTIAKDDLEALKVFQSIVTGISHVMNSHAEDVERLAAIQEKSNDSV
jgi:hypothetical protein